MVHGADDAAGGVQDDVHEDDAQCDPLADNAQQDEDVGDHDGGEQLEEVLDPQVHHPEAPELGDGDVGSGARHHPHGVEGGDRQGREHEQPGHVGHVLVAQARAHGAPDDEHPDEQGQGQQHLEDEGQVEVLPLLGEQRPLGPAQAVLAGPLRQAGQDDDHRGGDEQGPHQHVLLLRLAPGDERGQEQAGREQPDGGPEQGELDVPGAGQGEGQEPAQVEAEEGQHVGPVVLGQGPQERLDEEEGGDGEDVPGHHPLRLGQSDLLRLPEGQGRGLLGVPADLLAPAAVDGEHDPGSTDEDDQ